MSKVILKTKQIGRYKYSLIFFPEDGQYVVEKDDETIKSIHNVPEIIVTLDHDEALENFEALK